MIHRFLFRGAALLCAFFVMGCTLTQEAYEREYSKVWKELVKTKAWQEALADGTHEPLYASVDATVVVLPKEAPAVLADFDQQYESLVSRAYFKIITEAEKADARIAAEYAMVQAEQQGATGSLPHAVTKRHELVAKKHRAHRAMLQGLTSWNIFSPHRSGDLDYFKAENQAEIRDMMRHGASTEQMVNLLLYKLADLYHNGE